jgi:hypothetical protein
MYPSIENLLKIRDGEPIDAEALAYIEADMSAREELQRLRQTQQALKDLPEIKPPEGVWESIAAAVDSEAAQPERINWRWPLRGVIAASVAVLALLLVAREPEVPALLETGPTTIVGETAPTNRVEAIVGTPSYASLVAESARLDHALGSITYQPRVVRGSTASMIAMLEDRVAVLDDRLMMANQLNLTPEQRRALWQQRVDNMNALVFTRYAQAQRFGR